MRPWLRVAHTTPHHRASKKESRGGGGVSDTIAHNPQLVESHSALHGGSTKLRRSRRFARDVLLVSLPSYLPFGLSNQEWAVRGRSQLPFPPFLLGMSRRKVPMRNHEKHEHRLTRLLQVTTVDDAASPTRSALHCHAERPGRLSAATIERG